MLRELRISTKIYICCALFAISLLSIAQTAWGLGGNGGTSYGRVLCPRGKVVVGFIGRTGGWIDRMQLLCGDNSGEPAIVHPKMIGTSGGGSPTTAECGLLSAIGDIDVNTVEFEGTRVINKIKFGCTGFSTPESRGTRVFAQDDGGETEGEFCNNNGIVIGIKGNHGTFVNSISIICARRGQH
jgi:hypothetical protein